MGLVMIYIFWQQIEIRLMSTSSKILENQLEAVKKSPKKTRNISTSPHLTPRSKNDSSSDSDQYEPDELLKLQIKQIKRENNFLKKKVNQLIAQLNSDRPSKKKLTKKGPPKQNKDVTHVTVDFFFEQISELLNSVIDAFRVEFTTQEVKKFEQRFPNDEDVGGPVKKYTALKKFTLNRKLSKIMLEEEQKRYPQLLQVFTNYYKAKQSADTFIRGIVDKMTKKAIQLNKMIVERAQRKTHKTPKSHNHFQYQDFFLDKNPQIERLKLPGSSRIINSESEIIDKKSGIKRLSRITSPQQKRF